MTSLETWERSSNVAGGGDPYLFYVIYGDIDLAVALSRSTYRSNGVPDGVDAMLYGWTSDSEVPSSFREGFVWNEFCGADPALSRTVANTEQYVLLRGSPTDSATLNYVRDIVGLITHHIDHGGCAVYDPLILRWWRPEDWKTKVFLPAAPVPRHHAVILVSPEPDPSLSWFHTRGMRKFGRPDISIHDVSSELEDEVIDFCNRLIEHQAFGQIVPDGQEINMGSLPPGGIIRHAGSLDDPDFNYFHLSVTWPNAT